MPIKIATWNLCLGLFHKKDYVRTLLNENELDVLALQETELTPDVNEKNLMIRNYSIEVEKNDKKKRVAIYIKNTVHYKRREEFEGENLHLIILDFETSPPVRIITIYRTFNPQSAITPRENFKRQLNAINLATNNSTIILGDFNLDERKRFKIDYNQRKLFEDFDEMLGHHHFTQLVKEATWERSVENQIKNSVLDHIYCLDTSEVEKIDVKDTIFGDHKLVVMTILNDSTKENFRLRKRVWRKYSQEELIKQLNQVKWNTDIENVQELWNRFEQELLTVTDKLAPYEEMGLTIRRKIPDSLKKNHNRRNYLLKKRKRKVLTEIEKDEIKNLSRSIRSFYYEQRKNQIRRRIVPGNNKSLWDAVKIAKDIEPTPLPEKLIDDEKFYNRHEAPTAFATFFKSKVEKLEEDLVVDPGVWNGEKIINSEEINFMTAERVTECLKELKTKNCEGYDRLPLRILKDGAPVLSKPLSTLFHKIYETKEIPEQWKISKVIPLLKKRQQTRTEELPANL